MPISHVLWRGFSGERNVPFPWIRYSSPSALNSEIALLTVNLLTLYSLANLGSDKRDWCGEKCFILFSSKFFTCPHLVIVLISFTIFNFTICSVDCQQLFENSHIFYNSPASRQFRTSCFSSQPRLATPMPNLTKFSCEIL